MKRQFREATDATKYKMSMSKVGNLNPNAGRPRPEEVKQRISDSMKEYWSNVPFKNDNDKK
jgi:hypothetical protein